MKLMQSIDPPTWPALIEKAREMLPLVMVCLLAGLAGAGLAILVSYITGDDLELLTRDIAGIYNLPIYTGMISTLGIMLWAGAAAASFLGYAAAPGFRSPFLLYMGLISLILGLDDAFLFHEGLFPNILLIPEKAVYLAYLAGMLGWLWFFREEILNTGWPLLGGAFAFLGLSLAVDVMFEMSNMITFIEDSFKFTGIIFWLAYAMHTAAERLRSGQEK